MRPGGVADAETLAMIHAAAFEAPWTARALGGFMSDAGAITLIADDPPAGFILIRIMAGEAEVLTLAVAPVARRKGLARSLVEAAALAAFDAGAAALFLEVAENNAGALALYQSCSFREIGRRRGYYRRSEGPAMDALVLKRDLTANGSQEGSGA